jgi:sulfotransferase
MDNGLHFISGLPRSGSTLLAAILRQNPRLHANMSSPIGALFQELLMAMGTHHDYAVLINPEQRRNLLQGLFENYYKGVFDAQVVFDTNRSWCSRMAAIAELFPQARVIACVRDLAWIMDSFERLFRKNPLLMSRMFKPAETITVYTRMDALVGASGPVRFAWSALREAFYGEHADRLVIVDYEELAREPKRTIDVIYDRCGLPRFNHDFDNVSYEEGQEFDSQFGVPGLHSISGKVRYSERQTVLPPDLFERFANRSFWGNARHNRRNMSMSAPAGGPDDGPALPGNRSSGRSMPG